MNSSLRYMSQYIHRALSTEKSVKASESNIITFLARKEVTKNSIRTMIEGVWNISPLSIRTLLQKGKVVRFKNRLGKQSDFKKVMIKLSSEDMTKIKSQQVQ